LATGKTSAASLSRFTNYIGWNTQTVFSQLQKKNIPNTITTQIVANWTNVRSSSSIMYNCLCFAPGVK
jgi:hypothetical protein